MNKTTRREFCGRSIQAGLLGGAISHFWTSPARADASADLAGKAVNFLKPRQGADGSWSADRQEPGITALVVTATLRSGHVTPAEPAIGKAMSYLEKFLGPKGGLSEAPHSNYTTSIAIMAFNEANRDGRFDRVIKGGQQFLKTMQWDEGEGKSPSSDYYGGAGYGGANSRPDLSNTAYMMEAHSFYGASRR